MASVWFTTSQLKTVCLVSWTFCFFLNIPYLMPVYKHQASWLCFRFFKTMVLFTNLKAEGLITLSFVYSSTVIEFVLKRPLDDKTSTDEDIQMLHMCLNFHFVGIVYPLCIRTIKLAGIFCCLLLQVNSVITWEHLTPPFPATLCNITSLPATLPLVCAGSWESVALLATLPLKTSCLLWKEECSKDLPQDHHGGPSQPLSSQCSNTLFLDSGTHYIIRNIWHNPHFRR